MIGSWRLNWTFFDVALAAALSVASPQVKAKSFGWCEGSLSTRGTESPAWTQEQQEHLLKRIKILMKGSTAFFPWAPTPRTHIRRNLSQLDEARLELVRSRIFELDPSLPFRRNIQSGLQPGWRRFIRNAYRIFLPGYRPLSWAVLETSGVNQGALILDRRWTATELTIQWVKAQLALTLAVTSLVLVAQALPSVEQAEAAKEMSTIVIEVIRQEARRDQIPEPILISPELQERARKLLEATN